MCLLYNHSKMLALSRKIPKHMFRDLSDKKWDSCLGVLVKK